MGRKTLWIFLTVVLTVAVISVLGYREYLQKRDENARRAECRDNVRFLGLSAVQYADDHEGKYPQSLGVLMHEGYITTTEFFICWSGHDRWPADFPWDFKNSEVKALDQVEEFGSYVYVKGLRHEKRPDVMIFYDKPGHHQGQGRNCFFDDGAAKWLPEAEFQKRIIEQEANLRGK